MNTLFKSFAAKGASSLTIKVVIVVAAAVGETSLVSSSVFASLSASAFNTTPQNVNTGTLSLVETSSVVVGITGGFVSPISSMAPGDTVNRYIDLTNNGTLDETNTTISLAGSTPINTLDSDTIKGLQITIRECTVAWANTGVCSGSTTVAMVSTPAATMVATPQALNLVSALAGRIARLQVSIALPTGSEVTTNGVLPNGTVQNLTTGLVWTFLEQQRVATTTHN